MRKMSIVTVLLLFGATVFAEDFVDPATNIVYTLDPVGGTAEVKGGDVETWEKEYVYMAGSPEVVGSVSILDKFTVKGKEYTVTKIGDYAFVKLTGLTGISIPETVVAIGSEAFADCVSLESVVMSKGLKEISQEAFRGCTSLKTVTLPLGLKSIGFASFCECQNLESITIPESVEDVHATSFEGCDALCSIVVEKGNAVYDSRENCNAIIETKSNTLLHGCKNSTIPSSVTEIGVRAFRGCRGLEQMDVPKSVEIIGEQAFLDCKELKSVSLHDGLKTVGLYAFGNCALSELTIPASVEDLGTNALWMLGLQSITSLIENPKTMEDFCNSESSNTILYVPSGAKARYEATYPWNKFQEIIEIDTNGLHLVRGLQDAVNSSYDLQGRRLAQPPSKGIYVKNGRVLIVK